MNMIGVAALGVTAMALVLGCISLGIPFWVTYDANTSESNRGLWKQCITISGQLEICTDFPPDGYEKTDEVKVVRAMMFLGIFTSIGAIAAGAVVLFVKKDMKVLFFAAAGCAGAAGLFYMIAFAVFEGEIGTSQGGLEFDHGAAFALCIVSWIADWIAAGLFVGAKLMDK